jgi:hypothetical protein
MTDSFTISFEQADQWDEMLKTKGYCATFWEIAKWGADQELKECLDWLEDPCCADMPSLARDLKYSRRPPS